jgi:dUTP pyrophosphatase
MLVEDILGRIKGSDTFVYANHFQSLFKRTEDEFNQLNDRLLSAHSYTIKIPKNYHIMSQTTNKTESSDTLATAERVFTSPSGHKQSFYVKVVNPLAVLPEAPREGDSGIDLRACLPQDVTIQPLKRVVIPTGIAVRVPWGYEVQIRSRSGLAAKHGVFVLNSPATIDNSYQGELMVILFNTGDTDFHIHHGDRIAQMVVAPYYAVTDVIKTDEFETTTSRGDKGLGSTGVK